MFQSEDVGDNHRHRGTVQIYRVEEPKVEPNQNRNDDIRPDTDALDEIRQTCLRQIAMDRITFWMKISCISSISFAFDKQILWISHDLTKMARWVWSPFAFTQHRSIPGSTQSVSTSPIPTAWSTIVRQRTWVLIKTYGRRHQKFNRFGFTNQKFNMDTKNAHV